MKDRTAAIEAVVKKTRVSLGLEEAFQLFTRGMGQWWPLETHSIAADSHHGRVTAEDLVFEEREGGRIYETMSDGSEGTWGSILVWEPPSRVVFSWKPNLSDGPHTEVEVRFRPAGDATEVELEHRGWEAFGEDASARREGYDSGWPGVLEMFETAASL